MKHTISTSLSVIAATLAVALAIGASVFAGTPAPPQNGGQALEIAPPVISLKGDPGQRVTAQISLRNVAANSLLVTNEINDFTAAGEDGTPKLLLEEGEQSPYSLKGWIASIAPLTLKSRELKTLAVTINIPANAAPGGYYGVIRFSATPPDLEGNGVSLSASLGALVFMRVSGAASEKLSIAEFYTAQNDNKSSLFESAPVTFVQRVKNEGNVFEQPSGQVLVKDMFGNAVGATNVNLPPRNVLPGSIRKFEQPFDASVIGNKFLFGRYTADLKITYGAANDKTATAQIVFWVIPWKLIIGSIIALIAGFFLLRFLIRRYNESIISRSQDRPRRRR